MNDVQIAFVTTTLVPVGLIAIMFSLGLSLTAEDFRRVFRAPKAVLIGLAGQLVLLPVIGLAIVWLFQLPADMAVGLAILAFCPGGVTSNALVFAAKADVALSVSLTALSSIVTVITTPLLIAMVLTLYYGDGQGPSLSIVNTIKSLFLITALPVSTGMLIRFKWHAVASRLVRWLRPTSMIVLISVISFSVYVAWELVLQNIVSAGPAAYILNLVAMASGLGIAYLGRLDKVRSLTIGVEVGVQNATMAAFLTLTILESLELAVAPTMYGMMMIMNASILIGWFKRSESLDQANSSASGTSG